MEIVTYSSVSENIYMDEKTIMIAYLLYPGDRS